MTSVTETGDSSSWLKQRSSIFNGANTPKATKVVDKELARLKSSGVVSSIWSNKFVQEDNPGAKRASLTAFLQKDATSPKSASFSTSYNKQRSSLEANKTEITKNDDLSSAPATKNKEDQQITPEDKRAPATSSDQDNNTSSVTNMDTATTISTIVKNDEAEDTVASSPVQEIMTEQENEKDAVVQEQQQVDNIPVETLVDEIIEKSEDFTSHPVDIIEKDTVAVAATVVTDATATVVTATSTAEEVEEKEKEELPVKEMEQVPPFVAPTTMTTTTADTTTEVPSPKLLETKAEDNDTAKVSEQIKPADTVIAATSDAKEIAQNQSSGETEAAPATAIPHDASVSVTSMSPFGTSSDSLDTAAALWFQIETLKTKYAQEHARLQRAYEDIEFYKHQLELQSEVNKETLANAMEEREKEAVRVRQLAELIVKQDKLLNEYENNLAALTRLTDEATYLQETQAEMEGLRQELAGLNQQKKYMQGAIDSLRGELEMSYSQMRLVMAVSTEIQNDFEKHKENANKQLQDQLQEKDSEYQQHIKELQQQIKHLNESHQEASAAATAATLALEKSREVSVSTEELNALKEEVAHLKSSLEKKDITIQAMEQQMKDQKTDLENQIMELSQTIIEKDAHLLEIMNSRNNSESSIIGHMPPPPDSLYLPEQHYSYDHSPTGSQFHINQVRDYMLSSSEDEDDEDDREILHLSYSSDEDDLMMHHNAPLESPGTDSITSTITFESSEEERMSGLKHFSYTSVSSQNSTKDIPETLSEQPIGSIHDTFIAKETKSWPMPPPTPPPSEPLPAVPDVAEKTSLEKIDTVVPPPRRARAKTLVNSESSSPVSNELPRIIPLQKPIIETTPVPPPRKNIPQRNSFTQQMGNLTVDHTNEIDGYQHTKWMDDPESEDDRVKVDEWKAL